MMFEISQENTERSGPRSSIVHHLHRQIKERTLGPCRYQCREVLTTPSTEK